MVGVGAGDGVDANHRGEERRWVGGRGVAGWSLTTESAAGEGKRKERQKETTNDRETEREKQTTHNKERTTQINHDMKKQCAERRTDMSTGRTP